MSISAAALPLTAGVAGRLVVAAHTGSTNADLVQAAAADPAAWPHLSVLVTDDQRAGRGRLDRAWTAPAGTALAVSVLVRPDGIPMSARGWMPLAAGAAMTRALAAQLAGTPHVAELKWPNDVLVDGRKVCGILAEVVPGAEAIVVGAGINTAMNEAQLPVATAVSLSMLGVDADADSLIAGYLEGLGRWTAALAASGGDAVGAGLHAEVEGLCGTVGRAVTVALPSGERLAGPARRIDADGRLVVTDAERGDVAVGAGDVVHVR